MVPDPFTEVISNPLDFVRAQFARHSNPDGVAEETSSSEWRVRQQIDHLFSTPSSKSRIPSLNATSPASLPLGSLVRARLMVQDTNFRRELTIDAFRPGAEAPWTCLRYIDGVEDHPEAIAHIDPSSPHVRLAERQSIYAIAPPGETQWARSQMDAPTDVLSGIDSGLDALSLFGSNPSSDRDPLNEGRLAIILHIIGSDEPFKVNSMIEVIGILGTSPVSYDDSDLLAGNASPPADPPADMPCIHALSWTDLGRAHPNDILVDPTFPLPVPEDARASLLAHLTAILRGDALAAEFLLLHLASRLYHRVESIASIGPLSLSLSSSLAAPSLRAPLEVVMAHLLPRFHAIDLSLDFLGAKPWWPRDDGLGSGLRSGLLQLPRGTHLLVDESVLAEGQLGEVAIRNLRALARLAAEQRIEYAFAYTSEISMEAEIPLLLLSQGKSLIPSILQLPLDESIAAPPSSARPTDADWNAWRALLSRAHTLSYSIPSDVSTSIQDEFVNSRSEAATTGTKDILTETDLTRRLLFARILCASHGVEELTLDIWSQATDLDTQRTSRLPPTPQASA